MLWCRYHYSWCDELKHDSLTWTKWKTQAGKTRMNGTSPLGQVCFGQRCFEALAHISVVPVAGLAGVWHEQGVVVQSLNPETCPRASTDTHSLWSWERLRECTGSVHAAFSMACSHSFHIKSTFPTRDVFPFSPGFWAPSCP